MRRTIGVLVVLMAMALGGRLAGAQMVDPSTGIMVDAATDPMDFTAIMTGQPTNVGMEAALSANAQAQEMANQNMAAMQDAGSASTDASNSSDDTPVARAPALPVTPKPVITPGGGTFKASVQVTIADSDSAAAVFYTTDGKKPTTSSQRYTGPISVSEKTKVQALAFDVNRQPSGVVSKTFKVKAAKGSSLAAGAS
jgi:Chitobiase/beta-hexosaminidase C-terminal domain